VSARFAESGVDGLVDAGPKVFGDGAADGVERADIGVAAVM